MAQEQNIFEELAPYAKLTVVPGVTVGQLNYVNQQDLTYTAIFETGAGGLVNANTTLQFFQGTLGDSATTAGYRDGTLTSSQTTSRFPRGQAPANQAFVAVSAGFSVTKLTGVDDGLPTTGLTGSPIVSQIVAPDDLYALAQNFSWDLTIGRGITRIIGPLAAYCGPDAVSAIQGDPGLQAAVTKGPGSVQLGKASQGFTKLKIPVVFPPLVNVSVNVSNGSGFTLASGTAQALQVRMTFRGYLMTMPV